ncbi:MAG TPA: IPT/TIG domain-containing protein [Candidatus Angelobacter sp.]|nr:IPT/TIG domain-containing protein [Candidatus Angelobacter sp.]
MLTAFLVVMVGNSLAQAPTEFWPNSFSSTYISGDLQMQTSGWRTRTDYFSADLLNQPTGEYLIQAFDVPTGVPNSSYLINGAEFDFWMAQPTGTTGSLFPEAKLFLNGPNGMPICSMTVDTPLPANILDEEADGAMILRCTAASNIPVTPADHYYLWVGVRSTASPVVSTQAQFAIGPILRGAEETTLFLNLVPIPAVSGINPNTGPAGTQITIAGANFGGSQGTSSLQLGDLPLTVTTWSDTAITAVIPQGSVSDNIVMSVGGEQSNSVPFSVVVTPVLAGHFSQTVTAVTLTSPLALDWEHWGTSNDEPLVRMAGVAPLISDLSVIGSGSPVLFDDGEVEYLWTDGDVLTTAERTMTGVAITGTGSGFHLSVPADTIPRTFLLYTGAANAQAQLTASISDNSSAPYVDTSLNAGLGNDLNGTYKVDFRATQPGQTLNIDYVLLTDNGNGTDQIGKVTLQSAVLLPHLPDVSLSAPLNGQTLTAGTDISAVADAWQIDYPVTKVDLYSDSQDLFDALTAPYSFVITGATPGDHLLAAVATDANGLTSTSDPVLVTAVQPGGLLTATVDVPADVDLSAGTTDWVHWGSADTPDNLDRKGGITPQISDLTTLANGDAFITDETGKGSVNYSWSGGTPTDSQPGTGTQVFMQGYKNGFSINMPADQTPRTAKLYLGYGYGASTLRVSLSDGSASPWINTFSTTSFYEEKVVTIQFQAASPGQKLLISDQVTNDGGFAYVDLESATVSDPNSPLISTLSPITGGPGTVLTISGSNFGDAAGSVTLNGSPLTVNSWTSNSIAASLTGGY